MQKRKSIFLSLIVILICFISLFAISANAEQIHDLPSDSIVVSTEENYCGCCHEHNHSGFLGKISCIFCKISMFFKGIFGKGEENPQHKYALTSVRAATCSEAGTKVYTCLVCDKTETQTFNKLEHMPIVMPAREPTCITSGLTQGSKCAVCRKVLTSQKKIEKRGHTLIQVNAQSADCKNSGWNAYEYCAMCDYTTYAEISVRGHSVKVDAAVAPTCTETGLTEGEHCSVCNEVLAAQEVVAALGHTEVVATAVAPTCTTTGLTEGKYCSVCGEVLVVQKTVVALGHAAAEAIVENNVNSTCTDKGSYDSVVYCSVCDMQLSREKKETAAKGHTPGTTATCTDTQKCAVCQEVLTAALGHTEAIDASVVPTCTTTGLTEGKHCSVCGKVIVAQKTVAALGHTAGVAATCTEAQKCTVCQEVLTAALGHTEAIDAAVTPTCTATGLSAGAHCSVCDAILLAQENVPALGHTQVIDAAVAPTCTATGLTEGKHCSVCYVVLTAQTVVSATGHTAVADAAVAPTCTETGLSVGTHCSVCDVILLAQETVPALGHTQVIDAAVAPTCTETGLTEGKHCSVCYVVLTAQTVVSAVGHAAVADAAVAPTCTETGLTAGTHCSVCGVILLAQANVPATGHDYSAEPIYTSYPYNDTNAGKLTIRTDCLHCSSYQAQIVNDVTALVRNVTKTERFSTVEDALDAAVAGDTVFVVKDTTIARDATVPADVTLLLPCDNAMNGYMANGYNLDGTDNSGKPVLYRTLTINSGVSLTVNGTLLINAVTGRPQGGSVQGYDNSGNYAQINLAGNITVNNGGVLDCAGFVSDAGGDVMLKSGALMYETYAVQKWRGGTYAASYVYFREIFYPIYESHMNNMTAKLYIESGATLNGTVKMFGNKEWHYCRFPQIDNTNGLIRLDADAYVIREIDTENSRDIYSLYGNTTFFKTAMDVVLSDIPMSLSTDKCKHYLFDGDMTFNFYKGTHIIKKQFVFLPGGQVNLYDGANVVCEASAGFSMFDDEFYKHDGVCMSQVYQYIKRPKAILTMYDGSSMTVTAQKSELFGEVLVYPGAVLNIGEDLPKTYTFKIPNAPQAEISMFSGSSASYVLTRNIRDVE